MILDQPKLYARLIAQNIRQVAGLFNPVRAWGALTQSTPVELILVPQDLRTADPVLAQEFYNGIYSFAGKTIDTGGRHPFSADIAKQNNIVFWQQELHSFRWLRHIHSSSTAVSASHAQSLVRDWISEYGKPANNIAWQPQIAAQRLMSWLSHSLIIVDNVDVKSYNQFIKSIGVHIRFLQSSLGRTSNGLPGLQVRIALAYAALCVKLRRTPTAAMANKPHETLANALTKQIYADGGHVSRCPAVLPEILIDLLPLRQSYDRVGIAPPLEVLNAIDRIMPAIRYYRHRDGNFARFNGVGASQLDLIATVLRYDDAMGEPTQEASQSGFQRLTGGPTTLIMDVGNPPKGENSTNAHAGCLSFEMSSLRTCFITNCGAPQIGDEAYVAASRSSAAHSTAIVNNTSSCRFHYGNAFKSLVGGQILSGPARVASERKKLAGFTQILARHDGYLRQFGIWHERIIQLSDDGNFLFGRDRFFVNGGKPPIHMTKDDCAIRFHLHPAVHAGIDPATGVIIIRAGENQSWSFACDNGKITLEESVFFAAAGGRVAGSQIVVNINLSTTGEINWRFEQTIGTRQQL